MNVTRAARWTCAAVRAVDLLSLLLARTRRAARADLLRAVEPLGVAGSTLRARSADGGRRRPAEHGRGLPLSDGCWNASAARTPPCTPRPAPGTRDWEMASSPRPLAAPPNAQTCAAS